MRLWQMALKNHRTPWKVTFMPTLDLIAYLCSRLCHDLVSPVGALANGIEILRDETDPSMREQAMDLLAQSAAEGTRRLQYYRMAFGALGGLNDKVTRDEVRRAATSFFGVGRTSLNWESSEDIPAELDKLDAKLILTLLLVAQALLPRGGLLVLRGIDGGGFSITAKGNSVRTETSQLAALTGNLPPEELDSHNAIASYACVLAKQRGAKIEIDSKIDGQIAINLRL